MSQEEKEATSGQGLFQVRKEVVHSEGDDVFEEDTLEVLWADTKAFVSKHYDFCVCACAFVIGLLLLSCISRAEPHVPRRVCRRSTYPIHAPYSDMYTATVKNSLCGHNSAGLGGRDVTISISA